MPADPVSFPSYSGIRVVVVAHGPPLSGGITTVAMDLVEDPGLNAEFDMVFLNTAQNEGERGRFSAANVQRMLADAAGTFRLARPGAVVHTHSVQEPWPVVWRQVAIAAAARLRRARVVVHNHAAAPYMLGPGEYRPPRPARAGFAVLDRLVDANVLLSAIGVDSFAALLPHTELPVIANSAVVEEIPVSSVDHEPPVVLFVGELLARKGVRTLLDALDLLDAEGAAYELRIVGNDELGVDPDKDEMIAEVHDRGRGAALTGRIPRAEVYRHLSESDVLVLPTDYEGQPFIIIEALAAGVPIVATDIGSIRSMVDDPTNARLVAREDTAGFATAIRGLLVDPARRRRMGAANRELARSRFDRSVFRDLVAQQYRRWGRPG